MRSGPYASSPKPAVKPAAHAAAQPTGSPSAAPSAAAAGHASPLPATSTATKSAAAAAEAAVTPPAITTSASTAVQIAHEALAARLAHEAHAAHLSREASANHEPHEDAARTAVPESSKQVPSPATKVAEKAAESTPPRAGKAQPAVDFAASESAGRDGSAPPGAAGTTPAAETPAAEVIPSTAPPRGGSISAAASRAGSISAAPATSAHASADVAAAPVASTGSEERSESKKHKHRNKRRSKSKSAGSESSEEDEKKKSKKKTSAAVNTRINIFTNAGSPAVGGQMYPPVSIVPQQSISGRMLMRPQGMPGEIMSQQGFPGNLPMLTSSQNGTRDGTVVRSASFHKATEPNLLLVPVPAHMQRLFARRGTQQAGSQQQFEQPATQPMGQMMGQQLSQPIIQQVASPMTQQVTQPIVQPMVQMMGQPIGQQVDPSGGQAMGQQPGFFMGQMIQPPVQQTCQQPNYFMGQSVEQGIRQAPYVIPQQQGYMASGFPSLDDVFGPGFPFQNPEKRKKKKNKLDAANEELKNSPSIPLRPDPEVHSKEQQTEPRYLAAEEEPVPDEVIRLEIVDMTPGSRRAGGQPLEEAELYDVERGAANEPEKHPGQEAPNHPDDPKQSGESSEDSSKRKSFSEPQATRSNVVALAVVAAIIGIALVVVVVFIAHSSAAEVSAAALSSTSPNSVHIMRQEALQLHSKLSGFRKPKEAYWNL